MTIRLNSTTTIENLRGYPAETVERLRTLLLSGATAYPDIHREDFYDVIDGSRVYFIHISPSANKAMLLASWSNGKQPTESPSAVYAA